MSRSPDGADRRRPRGAAQPIWWIAWCCAVLIGPTAAASDYLLPSVLLSQGGMSQPYGFDSRLSLLYTGDSAAQVDLYLIDRASGYPLVSATGQPVCYPCTFVLDGFAPQTTLVLDDLVLGAGGFPIPFQWAYARIVAGGADPASLAIQAELLQSHATGNVVGAAHVIPLIPIGAGAGSPASSTFPLLAVTPGHYLGGNNTDGQIDLYYVGDSSVSVRLLVLDEDGNVFAAGAGSCAPCLIELSPQQRYQVLRLDSLLAEGTLARRLRVDLSVTGDSESLGVVAFLFTSQSTPIELSIQYFTSIPVAQNMTARYLFGSGFEGVGSFLLGG